jgi:hypothetical protein
MGYAPVVDTRVGAVLVWPAKERCDGDLRGLRQRLRQAFQVTAAGATHTFDSFECAIHALAPTCEHCGCRIIGHGVEADGRMFCCANCAKQAGIEQVADRA